MKDLAIKTFPNPILRKRAAKVLKVTSQERDILNEMAKVMYLAQGVGLAASQVGIDKQLAVIDIGNGLIKLINPVIARKEGSELLEEGCLSVPGISVKVRRARAVTVNFLDDSGSVTRLCADGLLARALQHEIDHLSGVLIIDYLNPVKKLLIKHKIGKKTKKK
ncbi:MAG: peptide deformylase [Candidatus Omnitrophica bacterium]|nr:peptide deformylase [Candidatus Omnitrophota bacterium]MDD5437083.1 peptide deformylase [Candidatus Omnitrophota bacterium]